MCDYCGCRSEPEIAALSVEHERMLALTARLRRAHEAGVAASEVVAELAGMLGRHARREERGVFAALLAEGVDAEYIARFEHEHDTLEELLSGGDVRSQTLQLVELLEGHILREESDLFPAAHQMLGSDAWATIAAPGGDHVVGDAEQDDRDHGDSRDEPIPTPTDR